VLTIIGQPEGTVARKALRAFIAENMEFAGKLRAREGKEQFAGERVDISAGTIPAMDFFAFLGDFTGLTVIPDVELAEKKFNVPSNVVGADAELAAAIVEAHGCRVRCKALPGNREILRITPRGKGAGTPDQQPTDMEGLTNLREGPLSMHSGRLEIRELVSALEIWTGLSVLVDDAVTERTFIFAPMEDVDFHVARELLDSAGCVLEKTVLKDGKEALLIRASGPADTR
jgi:hypothetical protein